jgi:hypothetical protein
MSSILQFFDELDFSKLKRLPTTIQFYSDQNFLPDHFMDSPQLMRLQTTNAKTEKYELRHEGRFGSLKIFFGICSQWPNYLTVRIVD